MSIVFVMLALQGHAAGKRCGFTDGENEFCITEMQFLCCWFNKSFDGLVYFQSEFRSNTIQSSIRA